jgi:hypothetical protein
MSDTFDLVRSPRLSIVIPTPADTAAMEETLVSVLEHRPDDCEIVVSLGCEYADPWNIREEVRFVQAPSGSTLVGCVNLGVAASEGEVVHVLAAGWRATEGWTDRPMERLEADDVGAVVPLGVAGDDRDHVVSAGVRCAVGGRRIDVAADTRWRKAKAAECPPAGAKVPQGPVLEAGFWRSDVLNLAGRGFTTVCGDATADADMAITLSRSGLRVVLEPYSQVIAPATSGRVRSRSFAAGLHAERLFWRSVAGSSFLPALVMHVVEVVRHAVARAPLGTLPMLVGRMVAVLQFGSYVSRYLQLRQVIRQAADSGRVQQSIEDRQTIRIDDSHTGVGRPRHRGTREAAPLRKSA